MTTTRRIGRFVSRALALLSLLIVPLSAVAQEVDTSPLPVQTVPAFEKIKYTGWEPVTERGKLMPIRPIVLTHAGDGSGRTILATQRGVIHILPSGGQGPTKVFFDMQKKVVYKDNQNEEGFLGLAFHPKFKQNGQFFVYYTTSDAPQTSVVSRFRVSKSDPDRADPRFEEEILRVKQPFWNHNGGTICFGPDGYLYVALGDGGSANDPRGNAQNLQTLLGSILRIDVDTTSKRKVKDKEEQVPYGIPADNPFVGNSRQSRPEIWAYGLRNVWRMAFDRKTGALWAGDVGQDIWEEIDIITRGGNYGWNLREGRHKFGPRGAAARDDLIDPVWEYHHKIGKSITGGHVYRGRKVPELDGLYVYADYVSSRMWALRYDPAKRRAVGNHPIEFAAKLAVLSFGEDEAGEVYALVATTNSSGIYRFERKGE